MDAPAPSQRKRVLGIGAGVAAGALLAFALYLLARAVQPDSGLLLISVMLIPAAACALAVIVTGIGPDGHAIPLSAAVVGVLLVGSAIIFREGAICLAMAAPIFFPLGMLGGVAAKYLRGQTSDRRAPPTLVVLLPALLLMVERPEVYPTLHASVVTQIEIEAPAARVWQEAAEIRDIAASEQSWTIAHDLLRIPRPVDARLVQRDGDLVRAATWRGDIRFFEVVTDWRPQHSMAWRFDIPDAAANRLLDEHLRLDQGYLHLDGGSYRVEALSPGRTRLTLTTQYTARTPLNDYASAWGDLLLGDIHRNVLQIVRRRAEARIAEES